MSRYIVRICGALSKFDGAVCYILDDTKNVFGNSKPRPNAREKLTVLLIYFTTFNSSSPLSFFESSRVLKIDFVLFFQI